MTRRSAVRGRIGKTMGDEPFPEWEVAGRLVLNRILSGFPPAIRHFAYEFLEAHLVSGRERKETAF